MKFLLDTNVFIEAKNRYYAFDICPGFWDWMDAVCDGDVASIVSVRDEMTGGNDELANWPRTGRMPRGSWQSMTSTRRAISPESSSTWQQPIIVSRQLRNSSTAQIHC